MSSANLDGMPKGNKAYEMINISCELQMYLNIKSETEQEMKDIDEALEDISKDAGCEFYGSVLRKWYIDGIKPKEEIARQLNYSSKTSIYDIRHDAIRKLAVALYGKRALDAI